MVAQGVPFAREYGGLLDNRSFGGAQVSRTFYARGQTGQQLLLGAYQQFSRQVGLGGIRLFNRSELVDVVVIDGRAAGIVVRDLVTGDARDTTIVFDAGGLGGQTYYDYRYLLHPIQIERVDVHWIDRQPLRCVIGSVARAPEDEGWTVRASENDAASRGKQERGNIVLWMRTGVDSC